MSSRRILTPAAREEIRRLYELKDVYGRPVHTQMEIASMLGVSETTVFRAVHRGGAYQKAHVPSEESAQESQRRFLEAHPELGALEKMAQAVAAEKEKPKRVEGMLEELGGEASPLTQPGGAYDFIQRKEEK